MLCLCPVFAVLALPVPLLSFGDSAFHLHRAVVTASHIPLVAAGLGAVSALSLSFSSSLPLSVLP